MGIKIGIVGSRNFNDFELLEQNLIEYCKDIEVDSIVSGGASGADKLGELFADKNNYKKEIYLPDWKTFGKSAGFKRNIQIVENSDIIFAFWDGKSKGTKHSIDLTKKAKKPIKIIYYGTSKEINRQISKIENLINKIEELCEENNLDVEDFITVNYDF